jgi:cyclin B
MEDIIEEPILNIDDCDAKNPLAVVDYVEDLHAYYRKMEVSSTWKTRFWKVYAVYIN